MNLQQDFEAYERLLPQLLQDHGGEFVVIEGARVRHCSPSYEDALTWAYDRFDVDRPFFVKKITAGNEVVHFTRDLGPC